MHYGRWAAMLALGLIATLDGGLRVGPPRDSHEDPLARKSVIYRAAATGKAGTFLSAVWVSGLTDALLGGEPCTVFVPTDEAFAKLPEGTVEALLKPENKEALKELLAYHVVPGKILAKDVGEKSRAKTLAGASLTLGASGSGIFVNESTVIQADVPARNGVIHAIDRVLAPGKSGLIETAEKAGQFKTLLAAVKAAKLDVALGGDGPFTVFAPTDEAFAKLGHETLDELLKPKNRAKLQAILKYHVVEGKLSAREAFKTGEAETLQGQKVAVDLKDGRLAINDAKVLATDIAADNGVIHVIDSVLVPRS
jgi:transforming growth factor-beta-induced protein